MDIHETSKDPKKRPRNALQQLRDHRAQQEALQEQLNALRKQERLLTTVHITAIDRDYRADASNLGDGMARMLASEGKDSFREAIAKLINANRSVPSFDRLLTAMDVETVNGDQLKQHFGDMLAVLTPRTKKVGAKADALPKQDSQAEAALPGDQQAA